MRNLLLTLLVFAIPVCANAQSFPQTNSNIQGQQATNTSPTTNPVIDACQGVTTGVAPAASSNRNTVINACDITGAFFVRLGSSQPFNCALSALGTTLTQCMAVSTNPYRYFVTDITVTSTTSTAAGFALEYGTGVNCASGTTFLYPSLLAIASWFAPANTSAPQIIHFTTPLFTTAAVELCAVGTSATNTVNIQVEGYLAP